MEHLKMFNGFKAVPKDYAYVLGLLIKVKISSIWEILEHFCLKDSHQENKEDVIRIRPGFRIG